MSCLIIFRKNKKVNSIFEKCGMITYDEFFGYFSYHYPKDYLKILDHFYDSEGNFISEHLFPTTAHNPDEYIENLYRDGKRKYRIRHCINKR